MDGTVDRGMNEWSNQTDRLTSMKADRQITVM